MSALAHEQGVGGHPWAMWLRTGVNRRVSAQPAAADSRGVDGAVRLEAVPTRRVNTIRAPASPVTTDAVGMAVVCQPLRVPKASH
jgi:hypothetical protein